jgi:diaminohydroxyphosphoribosylaminopyrimidine deaminase/5-amino-6-(5-phosphoribosylamino)uracil reductase
MTEAVFSEADGQYMRRALELASRGLDTTDPNPRVGCVLVRDGCVVGEGFHQFAGAAHAEVSALAASASAGGPRGATAYVSLEPCCHHGRTPPCVDALIEAGVARVVYAADDPNPRVSGGGAAALAAAGITVAGGLLAAQSRALNPGFFKRMQSGLPWVRVKLGASLDGRTALASGESRWITGEPARKDAQRFRARSSVVLTGIGTVLADDPAMNARGERIARQPLRVLLDSELRAPPGARIFRREGHVLVFTSEQAATPERSRRQSALEAVGARVEAVAEESRGRLDLRGILQRLALREANEVWVEAGATLAGAFLTAGLVDELVVYVAPSLLGSAALPLAQLGSPAHLEQRLRMEFTESTRVGDDLRIIARPCGR